MKRYSKVSFSFELLVPSPEPTSAVPTDAMLTAHGAYTIHRQETADGQVDVKNTVEYSRIEDDDPLDPSAGGACFFSCQNCTKSLVCSLEQFLEVHTTTFNTRRARVVDAKSLPTLARGLALATNPIPHAELKIPVTPSISTHESVPVAPSTAVTATAGNSDAPDASDLASSFPSTPTACPASEDSPDSDNSDNEGRFGNDASSSVSNTPSEDDALQYGPYPEHVHRRHERIRKWFIAYGLKARQAAEASAGESSPTPSLTSLMPLSSPFSLTPASQAATPTSSHKVPQPKFTSLQGPLSPLTPLTSSAAASRESTPEVNISDLFTPNTLLVWKDIDGGLEHGCSSPYRGPSTPRTGTSSQPIHSTHTPVMGSAARSHTPKRPVVIVMDSDSDEGELATPTHASVKKRRV